MCTKLKDLKRGEQIEVRVLVKSTEEKMGSRGPYTAVVLSDGESEIKANKFISLVDFPYRGKVIDAIIRTTQDGFYNIMDERIVADAPITDYIPSAPIDPEKAVEEVLQTVDQMTDYPAIQSVVSYIITQNADKLKVWAAAKAVHHNYLGGLLYHELRMLRASESAIETYGLYRTFVKAGIILHDIGKVRELDMDALGNVSYTSVGSLYGHLYMGAEMVDEACYDLGIDRHCPEIEHLKHIILSHHGEQEKGAVRMPATKEAYEVYMLDMMDSHMDIYENKLSAMEDGTVSDPVKWINGAVIYKYPYEQECESAAELPDFIDDFV